MPRRWLLAVFALLVLSIVLAQVYKAPLLNLIASQPEPVRVAPPPCDLNAQACPLPLMTPVTSEGPWMFAITPHPIPVSAPLVLTLTPPDRTLPINKPSVVWVDLAGDSMDMGLIRIPLSLTPAGRWEGSGSIPVCVTGQMRWRAQLHLQLEQSIVQADWVFKAPLSDASHAAQQ